MEKYLRGARYYGGIGIRFIGCGKRYGRRREKMKGRVTIFAVAITIMLLMALTMNVASAEPPAKVKLNPSEPYKGTPSK